MTRPRILVVDDSAFARKVVREILMRNGEFEVVGIARDGLEALEKIEELHPDVVTLDLVMPNLDGVGVLRALPRETSPRVVVVSMADDQSELGIAALDAGAVDVVHKPTAMATHRLYELADELIAKVRGAAIARPRAPGPEGQPVGPAAVRYGTGILVVGTSTGGPQALTRLIGALPGDFPVPMAIVLHIPPGYTEGVARRLDEASRLEVVEASEGLALRPGRVVLARAGSPLTLSGTPRNATAHLGGTTRITTHVPSVDALFTSAASLYGSGTLGLVLTGMGDDGLAGSRDIVAKGGRVITEAESSCVVFGMPRAVKSAGLSVAEAPLPALADCVASML